MRHLKLPALLFGLLLTLSVSGQRDTAMASLSDYRLRISDASVILESAGAEGPVRLWINGTPQTIKMTGGRGAPDISTDEKGTLLLLRNDAQQYRLYHLASRRDSYRLRHIPFWLSVLPPLVAIVLALIFKEVVISLFLGIWTGAFIAGGMRIESLYYFLLSILQVVEKYVVHALNDGGHLSVIVFSILIGGMVAIISRNGGMAGVVLAFSRFARTPRSAQFITWLLGVAIFFDDYANTLIVGNTMRPVTDRFKVSREKLAYIVDSTAAPVAAVAFITTWIGAELGYIDDGIQLLQGYDGPTTPYALFIGSLKYSFYPVMTLAFILMLIYTKRDYGKMYDAEVRARTTGKVSAHRTHEVQLDEVEDLSPVKGAPLKWRNAAIPVAAVIVMTIFGLIDTGIDNTFLEMQDAGISVANSGWGTVWTQMSQLLTGEDSGFFFKIGKLIGNADSYVALLWASLVGVMLAIGLTVGGRIMKLTDTISTLITGFKTLIPAVLILTLAWSLAATTEELHTATYLSSALQNSINPFLFPMIVFVLAAFISFSTGSSWSTMAILYPIAIPTTWAVCMAQGVEHDLSLEILLNVIAVVLAASVLGDHCSPISDTTILSSLASDCNHIDHVSTQLPYALTVGSAALIAGGLSTYLGGGWLTSTLLLFAGLAVLFGIVMRVGKRIPDPADEAG